MSCHRIAPAEAHNAVPAQLQLSHISLDFSPGYGHDGFQKILTFEAWREGRVR